MTKLAIFFRQDWYKKSAPKSAKFLQFCSSQQKNSHGFTVTGVHEKDLITHLHEFYFKREAQTTSNAKLQTKSNAHAKIQKKIHICKKRKYFFLNLSAKFLQFAFSIFFLSSGMQISKKFCTFTTDALILMIGFFLARYVQLTAVPDDRSSVQSACDDV